MSAFSWFKSKDDRTFEPPPPPPKVRVLGEFAGQVDEQGASTFFQLPAEIRNQIYKYVFGPCNSITKIDQESQDVIGSSSTPLNQAMFTPAHPLSLLLTCRKVNLEATILAFQIHPFLTSTVTAFHRFRMRVGILPPSLFNAITHLSHNIGVPARYPARYCERIASDFITNSILLFPTVNKLDIIAERSTWGNTSNHLDICEGADKGIRSDAIDRYVPRWLNDSLWATVNGHSFSWQKGQKWRIEYGLFDAEAFVISEWENPINKEVFMRGTVNRELIHKDKDLEACSCGCGDAVWLSATLTQETGRRVDVKAMFLVIGDMIYTPRYGVSLLSTAYRLRLRPDVERLPVQVVREGSGIMWDGEEEFWAGARTRQRGLKARMGSYLKGIVG